MEDCIFCKILSKEIPAEIVYEDDEILGFKDINPQAPVHLLFIPKKHVHSLNEMEEEDSAVLGKTIYRAKEYLKSQGYDNYRLVFNCGSDAGQTVYHIHVHAMAGRHFVWPAG